MPDYIYSMETRLTPDQQRGVNLIQDIARHAGLNLYLTGGTIRDLITGFPIRDIDLSVQGNPLKLQKELEKAGISIQGVDESLKALHLLLPGNVRAELNLTRSETYEKPGKPPSIAAATINEDLRRRDFTVNAMALSLNPGSRGLLLDPFNGVADVEAKVLRLLHNYAFLEDPIRLIRATRLTARFHWPLEERTQARYDSAKENNYIEFVDKRSIGGELEQLAHEEDPINIMRALEREGWLKVLHPHLSVAKAEASDLVHAIKLRQTLNDLGYSVESGPTAMYFLTRKMSDKDVSEIQRMIPRRDFVDKWKRLEHDAQDLAKKLTGKEAAANSGAWKILSAAAPERILFLSLTTRQSAVDQKIKNFLTKWRQVREKLPFLEMAEMRITPQLPEYPKILDEAFLQLLDGKLKSHNEIVNFLKPYEPPPPPPPPAPRRGRGKAAAAEAAHLTAQAGTVAAPTKRGRKPKGAVPGSQPVAVPGPPAEATKPAANAKVAAPAKPVAEIKKPVAGKATGKQAKAPPAKKKAVPTKKAAPAKKATPKKAASKKPAAKKAARKKR
ncbi:MAG TPA: CCA tRNA nucleotidyltransferase [Candidatus Eisenbacteria bacterium]|nr:CCA tRNA nucleotidyltransferase [Candidatus Eisenbacteria bacterium]